MKRLALVLVALGAASAAARADSLDAIIRERATAGLSGELAITAVHLSARQAKLDVAPASVDVDFPATARPGRTSVAVAIGKRKVFVPVTLAAITDVAIASRDLAAGEVVTDADVRWERRAATGAATVVLGAQVSAAIAAGELLDDARLTAPPAIARGTEVTVTVERGAVVIATRGTLEQAARLGASARVRLRTGGVATGTLTSADRVRVEAP